MRDKNSALASKRRVDNGRCKRESQPCSARINRRVARHRLSKRKFTPAVIDLPRFDVQRFAPCGTKSASDDIWQDRLVLFQTLVVNSHRPNSTNFQVMKRLRLSNTLI